MKKNIYIIDCLTNMHVGSGETNFNIVDNQVQRDSVTEFPTINSSSLKGALRDFAEGFEVENVEDIFGKTKDDNNNNPGIYKFFAGNLLVLPIRSNKEPFFRATTVAIIKEFLQYAETFGIELPEKEKLEKLSNIKVDDGKPKIFKNISKCVVEDYEAIYSNEISGLPTNTLGDNLVLMSNDDFKAVAKHLPVIARNKLENGVSKNLWYEEVVPREAKFYFGVITSKSYDDFETKLTSELVQLGANASIGYGYTKLRKFGE